jgi:hypothetical protein
MKERVLKQIKKFAQENNYDKVVLNIKKKKPIVIEGIKGCFVPEVLLYKRGKIKALVSFIESLEEIEEVYKLTLFIDYTLKRNLFLYILYDPTKTSEEEIFKKLQEKNIELHENIKFLKSL